MARPKSKTPTKIEMTTIRLTKLDKDFLSKKFGSVQKGFDYLLSKEKSTT